MTLFTKKEMKSVLICDACGKGDVSRVTVNNIVVCLRCLHEMAKFFGLKLVRGEPR